jgi:hypothetical protein
MGAGAADQHASVSRQVASTTITIEYNRPVARAHAIWLAGSMRSCGVWADYYTAIQLSTGSRSTARSAAALTRSGLNLTERWTMIFNRSTGLPHTLSGRPGRASCADHRVERTLAFYFPSSTATTQARAALGHGRGAVVDRRELRNC